MDKKHSSVFCLSMTDRVAVTVFCRVRKEICAIHRVPELGWYDTSPGRRKARSSGLSAG